MDILSGKQLNRKSSGPTTAEQALQNVDVVALYFSSSSCYACRLFTSYLAEVYRDLKHRDEPFEVVFASADHSSTAADEFVRESHADWLTVPFDGPLTERLYTHFSINRLPSLVLMKRNGDVITTDGLFDVIKVGANSYQCWIEGKKASRITDELPTDNEKILHGCCSLPWGNSETTRSGFLSSPYSSSCFAPVSLLEGKTLERKSGEEVPSEEVLRDVGVVVMCFWADWCAACKDFLPLLSDSYQQWKDRGLPIEVIFVKSDYCAGPKELFMRETTPDWVVVPLAKDPVHEKSLIRQVLDKFGIFRIPFVLVMKPNGELITTEGLRDVTIKNHEAYSHWSEGRGATGEEDGIHCSSSSCNGCCYFPWAASYHRKTSFTRLIAVCPPCPVMHRPPRRSWIPDTPVDVLAGRRLIRNTSVGLQETTAKDLKNMEVVGFYFAAHWCPPCRKFSPVLGDIYRKLKEEQLPIEIVFVSWDESESVMEGHMKESHADWLAVAYENQGNGEFNEKFDVDTIPHLCIVSKTGTMITKHGVRDIMLKKESAVKSWLQGIPATTDDDEFDENSELSEETTGEEVKEL